MRDERYWECPHPEAAAILNALSNVDPEFVGDGLAERPWELAEALFDRAERFTDRRHVLALMTQLLLGYLDRACEEEIQRTHLVLDPSKVAEDVVVSLYLELLEGDRLRPFARWARRAIRKSCTLGREDESLYPFGDGEAETREERTARAMARVVNRFEEPWREVLYRSWIEFESITRICETMLLPRETVEWVLGMAKDEALAIALGRRPEVDPAEPGSEEFWRRMEREGDDDG